MSFTKYMHEYEAFLTEVKHTASALRHAKVFTDRDGVIPPEVPSPQVRDLLKDYELASSLNPKNVLTDPNAKAVLIEMSLGYNSDKYKNKGDVEAAFRQKTSKVVIEELQNTIIGEIAEARSELISEFELLRRVLGMVEDIAGAMLEEESLKTIGEMILERNSLFDEEEDDEEDGDDRPLKIIKNGENKKPE